MRQSLTLEGNYLILLVYDRYDVPYRAKDGERQEDAARRGVLLPAVLHLPGEADQARPELPRAGERVSQPAADWLVSPPELGFLFPAFDDRSTNLYNALYYHQGQRREPPGAGGGGIPAGGPHARPPRKRRRSRPC